MADNRNQPTQYDAVKGSQASPPSDGVILGGLEGVQRRLASTPEQQRMAALYEALKYGEAGLDLVIRALQDESMQLEWAAYRLLRERTEPQVQQALQQYTPWRHMTCLRTFTWYFGMVSCVTISPDGQTIISCSGQENTIRLWNLHTGELISTLEGHSDSVNSVAISPDGQLLVSGSWDKTIKLWNLDTGKNLQTLTGHSDSVNSVAISLDGQLLVSGSDDQAIKCWNLHTGEISRTLEGHSNSVSSVAISSDGQTIVSGSWDQTIKFWNLHTGELLHTLEGHSWGVSSIAISLDGKTLASGSGNGQIKLWGIR